MNSDNANKKTTFLGILKSSKLKGNRIPFLLLFSLVIIFVLSASFASIKAVNRIRVRNEYLYYPKHWNSILKFTLKKEYKEKTQTISADLPKGGRLEKVVPLQMYKYRVKAGNTLSGIAEEFGLSLDTVASLNRNGGKGVHILSVGELLKIPSIDGIYLTVHGDFEKFCKSKGLSSEVVLETNGLEINEKMRADLQTGKVKLFFPGLQHSGIDRNIAIGVAFLEPVRGIITSGYGFRHDPFSGKIRFHRGIDIAAPVGTYVHAAMDGRVIAAGKDAVLGNYIIVKHPSGYSTVYGHLNKILVKRGKIIRKGEIIGRVGQTGRATGPHLHFEIRSYGKSLNPKGMIAKI